VGFYIVGSEPGDDDNTRWHPTGLRIFTNRDPNEVSRILDLEPTQVKKVPRGRGWESVWLWETGVDDTESFDRHVEEFMTTFQPRATRVRELASTCRVELRAGYAAAHGQGGITLAPDLVVLLAEMGAGICLDLYPPTPDHPMDLNADLMSPT
jgi:hypothetical protein